MRTFFSDTTKIDVIAHISGDDLEVDRLVSVRGIGDNRHRRFPKAGRPLLWQAVGGVCSGSLGGRSRLICLVEGVSGTPISGSCLSRIPFYRFDLRPPRQDGVRRIVRPNAAHHA